MRGMSSDGVARAPLMQRRMLVCVLMCGMFSASARAETAGPNASSALQLYQSTCSACHGAAAEGDPVHGVPALAGQRPLYLLKRLRDLHDGEGAATAMDVPAVAVSPQEAIQLSELLARMPPTRTVEQGPTGLFNLGEAIFTEQCAACHGGDAAEVAPLLRHQHFSYLARLTRRLGESHRYNVDADLVRFLRSLTDEEVNAVAAYLAASIERIAPASLSR